MTDVFLSHNSADKPAVEAIAHRLRKAGIEPWLDKWNLIPGNPWQEEIEQALAQCKTCAVFIGLDGMGPWHHEEMRALINRRVTEGGFRVIPVLLPGATRDKRSKLPVFLTATTWVEFRDTLDDEDAFQRLLAGIRGVAPGAGVGGDGFDTTECPYRGLEYFDVQHAPLFFGRAALTEWLLEAIRPTAQAGRCDNRFLAILGASGSGKSSLARAGLLAALHKGALPDSQHWVQLVLRPGAKPLESLAIALASHPEVGQQQKLVELIPGFRQHDEQLHWACRQALHNQPESRRMVLLVDQFEEVFTLCADEAERQAFIRNLLTAATDVTGQTLVLLTLRADFYAKCAAYPQLAAALSDEQLLISPMSEAELREAIVTPAQKLGCELEPGLLEVLLQDVQGQPGSLPLLEYTLTRLWEQMQAQQSRVMRLADYRELSGLEGALQQRADALYDAFSPEQQALCQRVFLRLVQPGEGTEDTRRRAHLDEFGDSDATGKVIQQLANARLITTQRDGGNGRAVAEVSHEALIRNWPQLRGWVEADRASLRLQHQISQAAEEWEQKGKEKAWLFSGSRLVAAREWLAAHPGIASQREQAFIRAGLRQRRRGWVTLFASVALALLITSGLALWAMHSEQARTASLFTSTLTHASLLAKGEDFADARAKLDSVRQYDADVPAASRHARDLLAGFGGVMGGEAEYTYEGAGAKLSGDVAISPDGRWLAASGERGTLALFDRDSGELVQKLEGHDVSKGKFGAVMDVVFHPDQPWLFSGGEDGQIVLWALPQAGGKAETLRQWQTDSDVWALALTPGGKVLASGHGDGKIRLWEVGEISAGGKEIPSAREETPPPPDLPLSGEKQDASPKLLRVLEGHAGMIGDGGGAGLAFSPDGRVLASASHDATVRLWDWEKGESLQVLRGHSAEATGVAFSLDGQTLASSSADQNIILWDAHSGQLLRQLKGHQNEVFGLQFLDDSLLASASSDNTIRLWDVQTGVTRRILQGHTVGVLGLAVREGQGRRLLYSASNDGTVKRWDADLSGQWLVGLSGEPFTVAISPYGKIVLVGFADGSLRAYDLASRKMLHEIKDSHKNTIARLAFNADGNRFASGGADAEVHVWDMENDGKFSLEKTLEGHERPVEAVAFSHDGSRLATASFDGRIGLFDLEGKEKPLLFDAHEGEYVGAVNFDSSGKELSSAGSDGQIKLWDLTTQPPTPTIFATAADALLSASLSPDGSLLASVGREGSVSVYPTHGKAEPLRLNGHEQTVLKAIFSPDSRQLATVSADMTVRVWDLDMRGELFRLRLPTEFSTPSPLWDFDFRCTPTGCWIAVPLTSGKLALYNLGKIEY